MRKPTPAMAVAIVAMVLALAGTSMAGVATISVLNKKEKKQTRSIAQAEITKAAPGLEVGNAQKLDGIDSTGFVRAASDRVRAARDDAFVDDFANQASLLNVSDLAGGDYVIWAKLNLDNDSAGGVNPNCELVAGGSVLDVAQNQLAADAGPASFLEFSFVGTFTASAAGTDDAFVRCEQTGTLDAYNRHIVAMRVN